MIDALKNFSIDKSDWAPVKFGDVVFEPKESVKDPVAAGVKHVVGLEHIDSEDIHLRRSAGIEKSTTFTKKFSVDDVLFGRRRAYLKKAARAEFGGICSGDIIVMRAKEDLLPELLPFIVNSEKFFDFAIKHSAGGLSPRVKFKSLENYEFSVPPKSIQKKIASLVWSLDNAREAEVNLVQKLRVLYETTKRNFFENVDGCERTTLGDLITIKSGDSPSTFSFVPKSEGLPFYKVKDLNESIKFQFFAKEWVSAINQKIIPSGSILFPKRGAAIMTNKVRIATEDCHVDTNTMSLKVKDEAKLFNEFLYYFLIYKGLYKIADTAQIPQINNLHINPYVIDLPSMELQLGLVQKLDQVLNSIEIVKLKAAKLKSVQDVMIGKVF